MVDLILATVVVVVEVVVVALYGAAVVVEPVDILAMVDPLVLLMEIMETVEAAAVALVTLALTLMMVNAKAAVVVELVF